MNHQLLMLINGWAGHNVLLDDFMVFCAQGLIYAIFTATAVWLLFALKRREYRRMAFFAASLVITFVLIVLISHAYPEVRPFVTYKVLQLIPHSMDQAFPSDHAAASSALAFGFLFFTRLKKIGLLLLLAAVLVGFARVFTGVHYPGDIAGGFAVAFAATGVTYVFYRAVPGVEAVY